MAQHFTVGGYPNPDPHYISPEDEAQEYSRLADDKPCPHDGTFGSAPSGAVCNICGAPWAQVLVDRPEWATPAKDTAAADDFAAIARRMKEIGE